MHVINENYKKCCLLSPTKQYCSFQEITEIWHKTNKPSIYARYNYLVNDIYVSSLLTNRILATLGACMAIREVNVTYNYCKNTSKSLLLELPKTFSEPENMPEPRVTGKCSDPNSQNLSALIANCSTDGHWNLGQEVRCFCKPGFENKDGKCISKLSWVVNCHHSRGLKVNKREFRVREWIRHLALNPIHGNPS